MNKLVKRLLTGTLAFATILTALPVTAVHASGNQYWTESAERVGYIEHVMNDGSIKSTFNEGHMKVEGETAYCVDINTNFKNGYKTRSDASSRMSSDQIADVALSLEYVKQYTASHTNLNYKQGYLLEQCVVWQRLSEQLGWQCDNVRASYNEISQAVQNEVYAGAKAFVKANKGRYECGGYIYTGEGQDIGQFWAKLNVGNAKVKKTSSNPTVTDGNANYSFEGATFGVYSDKSCNSQLATLTADGNGDTKEVEVKAGTVYIKELSAPKGYKLDSTVHALNVEVGKTATLTVADTPKVTETLIDLFKIDMETGKSTPQGNASLEGAEFTWSYYDGYYNTDQVYEILSDYLRLRERMIPYITELMEDAHEKGTPVMRPLFYDFPEDKESWNVETEYMFGPKVLVKPITDADARETDVYLPGGVSWTNAWTGETFEGGQTVHVAAPIEQIPLFTRDGYKLPME